MQGKIYRRQQHRLFELASERFWCLNVSVEITATSHPGRGLFQSVFVNDP
jgi:hypothetical protein